MLSSPKFTGARFWKKTPAASARAGLDEKTGKLGGEHRGLDLKEIGRQVLVVVVDDDPVQADQIASFLRMRGIATDTASDGIEGLAVVRRTVPRVVITDIDMPGMDGIAFARALRALAQPPRIIMISGAAGKVAEANRAQLGVFAVVDKPIPLRALEAFVRQSIKAGSPAMSAPAGGAQIETLD
ncbi:MAG: response regulator [Alphaproteobacteria bacterium]|nr:response regulator [Alphaproteobacteria bacterium]